jgi:hypothetical protein
MTSVSLRWQFAHKTPNVASRGWQPVQLPSQFAVCASGVTHGRELFSVLFVMQIIMWPLLLFERFGVS